MRTTVTRAIDGAVLVRVGEIFGLAATADTGFHLSGIRRATIDAVGDPISIAVDVRDTAAAGSRGRFQRVLRTSIDTIGDGVAVGVHLCLSTTTSARHDLGAVVRAQILAVGGSVEVPVNIRNPARADAGGLHL